ncbi:hypothetical protein B0H16DRAFT_1493418 [Mycena metata]|uniref:DUF6535 domain-containing protein n=1 Tax=Mycena metata TaxID=1033252 RepID=A0AAD7KHD7_9AGAR|nr:hypothetical protein B0H16DRAFT_1493418 [Mycena metata]
MEDLNPPEYTRFNEAPPPYRPSSWGHAVRYGAVEHDVPVEKMRQFDELKTQQELQLLLGVLFLIALTPMFREALPMLGEPTASLHVMRVYGWFGMALFLSIRMVFVSLLCRHWLIQNNPNLLPLQARRSPGSLMQMDQATRKSVTKFIMNRLIAYGSVMLYPTIFCLVVGLIDFFWQLYPALVVTVCGIFGGGPVLSSLSRFKGPTRSIVHQSWRRVRGWSATGQGVEVGDLALG